MSEANSIPVHVGVILDGNRRWAKDNGLSGLEGHRKGYENLKTIVNHALLDRGVKYVSAYIFSTENWNRAKEEVSYLMDLAFWVATNEVKEIHKDGIRVLFLGSKDKISNKLLKAIEKAEKLTAQNTNGTVAICFNYGGQQEITEAVKAYAVAGNNVQDLNPTELGKYLYAPEVPPVDMIIRTSGEQRLSNFMLWRAAYSELYFVDKHWPAFTVDDLDGALQEYARRERRFGG